MVIAMGPWSILATRWLPLPAVFGYKGHSLVFETGEAIPAEALFLEYQEAERRGPDARAVPARRRHDLGVRDLERRGRCRSIPPTSSPDDGAHARLEAMCRTISPALAAAPIVARQACFRPVTEDGLPLIGAVPGVDGAYVATGHSVWGMLNAPATGEAMAELILDGQARPRRSGALRARPPAALDPARLGRA